MRPSTARGSPLLGLSLLHAASDQWWNSRIMVMTKDDERTYPGRVQRSGLEIFRVVGS